MAREIVLPAEDILAYRLSPLEFLAYIRLYVLAGGIGNECSVGYGKLAAECRVARSTIRSACHALRSFGLLEISSEEADNAASLPNRFRVLAPRVAGDAAPAPAPAAISEDSDLFESARQLAIDRVWDMPLEEELRDKYLAALREFRTRREIEEYLGKIGA